MVSNTKSSHCPSSPGQYVGVPRENGDKQRYRRPDQQFYVPRGRRHPDDPTPCSTPTPYDEHVRAPSPANSICSVVSEFSGRNRYNRHGKYNRMSYHEEEGKSYSKPPLSFSRESTMSERGGKCKSNLFAAETLQLIERCINHDTNRPLSGSPSWENSPHNKNTQQMKSDVTGFIKGSHSTRDNHPVHSKENLMHPVGQTNRSRKGRRNRKRDTRSRDPSSESLASYSRRGSLSTESLERTFYNSNTTPYERYHFNYDRLNSRNSSRANSRNPSVERIPPSYESHSSTPEWRVQGFSTPTSPVKHSSACLSDRTQRRHSLGKPPTGKIGGTAFNVHLIATSHTPNSSGRDSIEEDDAPPSYPKPKELGKENQVSPQGESQSVNFLKEDKERHTSCSPSTSYSSHEEKKITADEAPSPAENLESLSLQSNEIKAVPKSPESSSTPAPSQPIQEEVLESDSTTKNDENQIDGQRNSHLISNRDESPSIPLESKPHESPPPSPCCHTESKEKNVQSTETITLDDGEDDSSITKVKEKDDHDFTSDDVSSSSVASPEKLSSSVATPEKLPSTAANEKEEMNPKKFSFNWADEVDEDSWDALYDDSGNCLDSSIKNQLEDAIGSIKLQSPANDYLEFKPQEHQIVDEEYGHIIEIYDFPASFQTQDLLSVFQDFKGIDLKWVDDTHALGIFSSPLLGKKIS